jgi:hypothetical protein
LPHPFPAKDRAAGFRYQLFIQQAEFARTQVFDRPLSGRLFFEQVLRDNIGSVGRQRAVSSSLSESTPPHRPAFRTDACATLEQLTT